MRAWCVPFIAFLLASAPVGTFASTALPPARALATVDIPFVQNDGLVDADVAFYAQTFAGPAVVRRSGELSYRVRLRGGRWISLTERFGRLGPQAVRGGQPGEARVRIFRGRDRESWRRNLRTYGEVDLGDVGPGARLRLRAHGANVEKLFELAPGASASAVRVDIPGARDLSVNAQGELVARLPAGTVTFSAPRASQEIDGAARSVLVAYRVEGSSYGFDLGPHDPTAAVLIDPLLGSTLLGTAGFITALGADSQGNIFVAGHNVDLGMYDVEPGAFDALKTLGFGEAYVAKLDGDLTTLLALTYYGGTQSVFSGGGGVEFVALGVGTVGSFVDEVFVTGSTSITDLPMPNSSALYKTYKGGRGDGFVARFSNDLSELRFAMYLGGSREDRVRAMVLDHSGSIFVAGDSDSDDLPTKQTPPSAFQTTPPVTGEYYWSGFIAKLTPTSGPEVDYKGATYLGGKGQTSSVFDLSVDGSDFIFAVGVSSAQTPVDGNPFPTTSGAFAKNVYGPATFVAKMSNDLTKLLAATFLGDKSDAIDEIEVLPSGSVVVAGGSTADLPDDPNFAEYPTTPGSFQPERLTENEVVVSVLSNGLGILEASTFLHGGSTDLPDATLEDMVVDDAGKIYLLGNPGTDFPYTGTAYFPSTRVGLAPSFLARMPADLSAPESITALNLAGNGVSSLGDLDLKVLLETGDGIIAAGVGGQPLILHPDAMDTQPGGSPNGYLMKLDLDLSADQVSPRAATAEPKNLDLGYTPTGNSSAFYILKLRNQSSDPLVILQVLKAGDTPGAFSIKWDPDDPESCTTFPATLAPDGGVCTIAYRMEPPSLSTPAQQENAVVYAVTNDPKGALTRIADLAGISGGLFVKYSGISIYAVDYRKPLDFGEADVDETVVRQVELRSRIGTLLLKSVAISGPGAGAFQVIDDPCSTKDLGSASPCKLRVQFAPTAAGVFNAWLDFTVANTTRIPLLSIPLHGKTPGAVDPPDAGASDPGSSGGDPGTGTTDPGVVSTDTAGDPGGASSDPGAKSSDPGGASSDPGTKSSDPGGGAADPGSGGGSGPGGGGGCSAGAWTPAQGTSGALPITLLLGLLGALAILRRRPAGRAS